ncbi:GM19517 [Drosophila sechellia]|uniref:GM19517 n=1 Tax=Drosophila sechellia TaxID=7238 RepID=B4I747_DROSE|nr:GM19517 [Drosophila sechellia]
MAKDCNWKVAPNWATGKGRCMWQAAGVPDSATGIAGWLARWQDSRIAG